mmetsp:Transcript_25073/g.75273  ORF Transcript_25073/g.75273 Transcript_25073/m.75273 type:complete len:452 (-) Transcript_25073:349-1704(-)
MVASFDDGGFGCGLAADGLPVVAPRRALVEAMLGGADPRLSLGACPPAMRDCQLWQVAACAVLAGAEPKQFPVIVAAVKAALDPAFNAMGAGATTMGCTPLVLVSGGAQEASGVASGAGCLGSGNRANAAVGRALKLVLHHVGGSKLGGTESTCIGTPAKICACVGERGDVVREGWGPLTPTPSVTVCPLTGLSMVADFDLTDGVAIMHQIAQQLTHACWSARFPLCSSAVVLVSPEHYATLRAVYPTREAFRDALFRETAFLGVPFLGPLIRLKTGSTLLAVLAPQVLGVLSWVGLTPLTKFERPESISVVVCGGDAGKFSYVAAGFGLGREGMSSYRMSVPVTAPVVAPPAGEATALPEVVDPRGAAAAGAKPSLAPRTGKVRGAVALLDISKGGGREFLDGLEAALKRLVAGLEVLRYSKPTFSRNAPPSLLEEIAAAAEHCVVALAD